MSLHDLIAASFGSEAAVAWCTSTLGDDDVQRLASAGREVLDRFPGRVPGACALMSAVYAVRLEGMQAPPAYVVAGSLFAGDHRVFGEDGELDGNTRFSQSNLSWDGHMWLVHGNWLADASIFRTADSQGSPPALAEHVHREFGRGRGLLACKIDDAIKSGLRYEPQYVLKQAQVDGLFRGARKLITGH